MDYWEGKCFKCFVIGWLVAITALTIGGEIKHSKTPPPVYQDSTLN